MKWYEIRRAWLPVIALLSQLIYVLACGTAFSPDGSKIIYPSFDPKARALVLCMYDRKTGGSETFFAAHQVKPFSTHIEGSWLCPMWMRDGKTIVVAWMADMKSDALDLAILPYGGRSAPVRMYHLDQHELETGSLAFGLALSDNGAFFTANSNCIVRLDLVNGQVKSQVFTNGKPLTLLAPTGKEVYYVAECAADDETIEFGVLDTINLVGKSRFQFKLHHGYVKDSFFVASNDGQKLAYLEETNNLKHLVIRESSTKAWNLPLDSGLFKLNCGSAVFSPNNDTLYVTGIRSVTNQPQASLFILDISLTTQSINCLIKLCSLDSRNSADASIGCQAGLSPDGSTLALSTAYLCLEDKLLVNRNDCALYLVDLRDPLRKITKVPIPWPNLPH